MARLDVLQALYSKKQSPLEFNFDRLTAPPLLSLLSPYDIMELNKIARSVKLAGKIDEKYKLIDAIMTNRGFVKLHAGTNRVVYRYLEDQRFVAKIAVDRVGLGDNPAEFKNQFLLKPFVTKIFEVSPCGTIAIAERVDAIRSREEFMSVADDIFSLITKIFVGKYILEDFGSHYFLNWGLRNSPSFGPVLLDFPYVFELDGNKLYCNAPSIPGRKDLPCMGQLDYDDGFNNLVCTKCGRHYQARDLKKAEENKLIIVGGKKMMKVQLKVGKKVILDSSKRKTATVIEPETVTTIQEKVVQDKVESRLETSAPKVSNKPSDSIFKKQEVKHEEVKEEQPVVIEEPKVEEKPVDVQVEFTKEETSLKSMEAELDEVLSSTSDDFYEDEDDEYDLDRYLSNRQRNDIRSSNKKPRKGNNDFSNF